MAEQLAEQFISALGEIEHNKNFDQMLALYTDSSEIGNVALSEPLKGQEGAKEFWTSYRDSFDHVSSSFSNKIINDNIIALEWTTEFNRQNSDESSYRGVSVIETGGGKIKRFFAYFNPQQLGEQLTDARGNGEQK